MPSKGRALTHKMNVGCCLLAWVYILNTTPSINTCYGLGSPTDTEYVLNSPLEMLSLPRVKRSRLAHCKGCGPDLVLAEYGSPMIVL